MAEKTTAAPFELPYPTSAGEVKNGATDIEELAARLATVFKEHVLVINKRAASYEAASGELGELTKTAQTVTLPNVATANQIIGVFSTVAETKITTVAKIYGDFVEGASGIILTTNQHVVLQSNGANWFIIAGEPRRETAYVAQKAFASAESLPAAAFTRPASVLVEAAGALELEGSMTVSVGGVQVGAAQWGNNVKGLAAIQTISFDLNAGEKWSATATNVTRLVWTYKLR
jgi:hypothetical protein